LADERVERRLTAILAADVAGYSQLVGGDEERAPSLSSRPTGEPWWTHYAQASHSRGRLALRGDGRTRHSCSRKKLTEVGLNLDSGRQRSRCR